MVSSVPEIRVQALNSQPISTRGEFVLYWMTANRRANHNFSLQRAVQWALELGKPLLVLEALRCDYRWASDRLHSFVIQGMRDNAAAFEKTDALYLPYVEPHVGAGRGLLRELSGRAAVVVGDDFPLSSCPACIRQQPPAALPGLS